MLYKCLDPYILTYINVSNTCMHILIISKDACERIDNIIMLQCRSIPYSPEFGGGRRVILSEFLPYTEAYILQGILNEDESRLTKCES